MSQIHGFLYGLRYVQKVDWAWIHAKMSIGILCPLMAFLNPPAATRNGMVNPAVMNLILLMLAAGGIISIIGLLVRGTRIRPLIVGYAIEMAGLIPLIAGPLFLAIIYLSTAIGGGVSSLVGFAFCYTLASILFARYIDTLLHHLTHMRRDGQGLGNEGRT